MFAAVSASLTEDKAVVAGLQSDNDLLGHLCATPMHLYSNLRFFSKDLLIYGLYTEAEP